MKLIPLIPVGCAALALLAGCATSSEYVDASDTTIAVKNKDRMSSSDWVIISQEAGNALLSSPLFAEYLEAYRIDAEKAMKKAEAAGKMVRVYVPETRPYLQGAKLTLPSLLEMNVESYLITDAMPAFFMREKKIDIYMSASDAYLPDGSISNKIGTLENAIAAKYYGIPYYAFSLRSSYNEDIRIEYRSQSEIIYIDGKPITLPEAKAIYPAFDIIEPSLISGIITKDGIK